MLAQGRASRRGLPTRQRRDRAQAEARSIAENSVSARGPQAQALAQGRRLGNTRSGQARGGELRCIVFHRVFGRSRSRFAPVLRPEVADGLALTESKTLIDISSFLRCPISCEPLTAKDPETLASIAGQGSLPGQAGAVPVEVHRLRRATLEPATLCGRPAIASTAPQEAALSVSFWGWGCASTD